jgi:hypothetical protein
MAIGHALKDILEVGSRGRAFDSPCGMLPHCVHWIQTVPMLPRNLDAIPRTFRIASRTTSPTRLAI